MRLVAVSILKVETVLSSAEEQPWTLVWGKGSGELPWHVQGRLPFQCGVFSVRERGIHHSGLTP